jgi:hypothetical protein
MITLVRGRAAERTLAADLNANFLDADNDRIVTTLTALAANGTFTVPAGYRISHVDITNTTANAVTGGIHLGTTALGSDIVNAKAIGANARVSVETLDKRFFAAEQIVYISAHTAWNSASLTVVIMLDQMSEA